MNIKALYPVICVDKPMESAKFFIEILGFKAIFEQDWYVHLLSSDNGQQIGLVYTSHESVPVGHVSAVQGCFVTIEPENIDETWNLIKDKVEILHPLKTESWGQKHFICLAPGNIMIDFVEMVNDI